MFCKYDTDGDGNCPIHPRGCVDAMLEEVADDLLRVDDAEFKRLYQGEWIFEEPILVTVVKPDPSPPVHWTPKGIHPVWYAQ